MFKPADPRLLRRDSKSRVGDFGARGIALSGTPGKPILGIYEFDGDKLRICNARPGQPSPKNFDAKQYTGHALIVWEREAK